MSDRQGRWIDEAVPAVSPRRETVYNFVDTDTYHPDAAASRDLDLPDGPVLLYAGRKVPHKGLHRAVEALDNLPNRVMLVVLGPLGPGFDNDVDLASVDVDHLDPYLRRTIETAREAGVEHRVEFLGYVPDDVLPAYYAAADVTVFPSVLESFGMVPIESMACGTPVVAHALEPMTEIIPEQGGRLVDVSAEAIAHGAASILEENASVSETAGREHVVERFSKPVAVKRQLGKYRDILGE